MTKTAATIAGSVTIVTVAGKEIAVKPAGFFEWEGILEALDREIATRVDVARQAFAIFGAGLQRSHPGMTAEWIEANISAGEVYPLIGKVRAFLEASGLAKKATDTGEAHPANGSRARS